MKEREYARSRSLGLVSEILPMPEPRMMRGVQSPSRLVGHRYFTFERHLVNTSETKIVLQVRFRTSAFAFEQSARVHLYQANTGLSTH